MRFILKTILSHGIFKLEMFDTVFFSKDHWDSAGGSGMNYFTIEKI